MGKIKFSTSLYWDSPREQYPDEEIKKGTKIEINGIDPIDNHLCVNTSTSSGYVNWDDIEVEAKAVSPSPTAKRNRMGMSVESPSKKQKQSVSGKSKQRLPEETTQLKQPGSKGFVMELTPFTAHLNKATY